MQAMKRLFTQRPLTKRLLTKRLLTKRLLAYAAAATAVLILTGCATQRNFQSQVKVFSDWPSGDAVAKSYSFARTPEQDKSLEHKSYETAVREVLASKGFSESAGSSGTAYKVALSYGVNPSNTREVLVDDPYYGAYGSYGWPYWRPHVGLGFGGRRWGGFASFPLVYRGYEVPIYQRELKIEISDAASGSKRYEATARNESRYDSITKAVPYLARAALDGFPQSNGSERVVLIPVPEPVAASKTPEVKK
jgi:Domain of unknown function (DUF4136)